MKVQRFDYPAFRATSAASNGAVFHREMTAVTWSMRKERKRKQTEAKFTARCEARAARQDAAQIKFSRRIAK